MHNKLIKELIKRMHNKLKQKKTFRIFCYICANNICHFLSHLVPNVKINENVIHYIATFRYAAHYSAELIYDDTQREIDHVITCALKYLITEIGTAPDR